jgi:hypothetical protein
MASDPALLDAFARQARAVLAGGDALAFLGLWAAWKDQPGTDRDDLADVLRAEGAEAPSLAPASRSRNGRRVGWALRLARGGPLLLTPYLADMLGQPAEQLVTHEITSLQTGAQIDAGRPGLTAWAVAADRWMPGDRAVITSRDGGRFTGTVEDLCVTTGRVGILLAPGPFNAA